MVSARFETTSENTPKGVVSDRKGADVSIDSRGVGSDEADVARHANLIESVGVAAYDVVGGIEQESVEGKYLALEQADHGHENLGIGEVGG